MIKPAYSFPFSQSSNNMYIKKHLLKAHLLIETQQPDPKVSILVAMTSLGL